ncbi:AMP-binding protein, partial [Mycobacterium sp.]|uniref:AMP-binding protein n=1 Tax=Mycobacterium sp. TaxID=1785 RepID=UPI003C71C01B
MIATDQSDILWRPSARDIEDANVTHFMSWLKRERGITHSTWNDFWEWSIRELDEFWSAIWDYYGVIATRRPDRIISADAMPHTRWFMGAQLNYAQNILTAAPRTRPALIEISEDEGPRELSTAQLIGKVGALSQHLRSLGVMPGDRVAAYLPNTAEAVIAMLATTAIGAVWASCGPEFGIRAVVDRFRQISPKVLLAVDGYRFGGRLHERVDVLHELRR